MKEIFNMSELFETGMGVIRRYANYTAVGEITSIHEDADENVLITVMYDDGAMKTYTEECMMHNLGRRIIVTEEVLH